MLQEQAEYIPHARQRPATRVVSSTQFGSVHKWDSLRRYPPISFDERNKTEKSIVLLVRGTLIVD